MSLLDYFRSEYITGKVLDKYKLENGNIAAVIEDQVGKERYHVEFRDGYKGPAPENLFGIAKEPFASKTEYLDKLLNKGNAIGLTLGYSKGPFRQAYQLHSVSGKYSVRGAAGYLPALAYR
jgi:hypothetical protein